MEERALIDALAPLGFVAVEPETLPFAAQIQLFNQADVIVGLGGAGLFNAVFARPGTRIVTIESTAHWVHAHANLFTTAGLDYGVIFGQEDPSDTRAMHRRWHLDVPAAVAAIASALN